jgi:opacity protein-like surface antigen
VSQLLSLSPGQAAADDANATALTGTDDGKSTVVDRSKEIVAPSGCVTPNDTEFRFSLPGWMAGLDGDFGVRGVVSDVDVKFIDLLKRLDMAVAGAFYTRWHRWEFFADGSYLKVSDTVGLRDIVFTDAHLSLKSAFMEAFVGYRVIHCESGYLSLYAGGRYNYIQGNLRITNSNDPRFPILRARLGIPNDLKVSGETAWVDPVIGIGGKAHIWKPISFWAKGDIGGFGAASDFVWQVQGGLEFQITRSIWADVGWRYIKNDYQSGGFLDKTALNGPYIETGFNF